MKTNIICALVAVSTLFGLASFTEPSSSVETKTRLRKVSYAKLNDCDEYGMTDITRRMKFDFTQYERATSKRMYTISEVDIVINDKSYEMKGRKIPRSFIKEWDKMYENDPKTRIEMNVTMHLVDKDNNTRMHSTVFYLGHPDKVEYPN